MKKILVFMLCFACVFNANAKGQAISFEQHISNLKVELDKAGHDGAVLYNLFNNNFKVNERIRRNFANQPEVKATFDGYVKGKLSDWRIKNGRKRYQKHKEFLAKIEKKYNVPGELVVALWGVETNYGTYPLKNNAVKALANLSYIHPNKSRRAFFKKELFAAFDLIDKFDFDPRVLAGSWAGALGQCQFMPSNVLAYAVDGDGDGKVDIWNSEQDVLASSANFINKLGWKKNLKGFHEVTLPEDFKIYQKRVYKSFEEWQVEGVFAKDEKSEINRKARLKLFAPINKNNNAYLTSKNFDVIKRWNNSNYFAFSVLALADEIKKGN